MDRFAHARRIADTVLYEGYVLYPYRASAIKNRYRWPFGVVVPRDDSERSGADPWFMQSELLIEPAGDPALELELRCLQVEERQVEEEVEGKLVPVESMVVAGETHTTWQEGVQQTVLPERIALREILGRPHRVPFRAGSTSRRQELFEKGRRRGRVTRRRWAIEGTLEVAAERVGPYLKVRLRIENETPTRKLANDDRRQALRSACIGTHALVAVVGGRFLSLADPPSEAVAAARSCRHEHAWPVLMGDPGSADTLLVSPILLEDHPRLAPESPGDLYDATEIDEILTLRIMTMTDEEKAEARGTDERARRVIERSDAIPDEELARLHGAIRSLRPIGTFASARDQPLRDQQAGRVVEAAPDPWRELLDETTPAEQAEILVGSSRVARGSRVRLHPRRDTGARRADAMDMFLENRIATVSAIHRDVDDVAYIAVTIDDDPARDLQNLYGRFYYFSPEEIEPVDHDAGSGELRRTGGGTLVAGVGNIFLGDDGFGVEVVARLRGRPLPAQVKVADFGIRGLHLAYELLDGGYETTILVDATPRGGVPGTVYLLEPEAVEGQAVEGHGTAGEPVASDATLTDGHGMTPDAVFRMLEALGGKPSPRVLVVGCEPASVEERMGLSDEVEHGVEEAVRLILDLLPG